MEAGGRGACSWLGVEVVVLFWLLKGTAEKQADLFYIARNT